MPRILAVLFVVALGVSSAAAQVFVAPPPPPVSMPEIIWNSHVMRQLGSNAAGQAVFGEQLKRELEKKGTATTGKAATASAATPVYAAALAYPFSGSHVLAAKIAEAAGAGAGPAMKADELNGLVAVLWSEYQISFREENERLKMPFNDVASAMTYCIVMSYMAFNGIRQLEADRSLAVYRQASRLFLDTPEFVKFSAADKQTLAEVLVAIGGMPGLTLKTMRDAAQAKTIGGSTLVKLFGSEGTTMRITEQGMEFAGQP